MAGELLDRHLKAFLRLVSVAPPGAADHRRRRVVRVPDHGRHRGRDVIIDRADRGVDQGVYQHALALLELAHHQDADPRVVQALQRLAGPAREIGPLVRGGGLERELDGLDGLGRGPITAGGPPPTADGVRMATARSLVVSLGIAAPHAFGPPGTPGGPKKHNSAESAAHITSRPAQWSKRSKW